MIIIYNENINYIFFFFKEFDFTKTDSRNYFIVYEENTSQMQKKILILSRYMSRLLYQ
jgi:hypothetical protein